MSDSNSVPLLVNVPDYGLVKILADPSTRFLSYVVDEDVVTVRWGINGYNEIVDEHGVVWKLWSVPGEYVNKEEIIGWMLIFLKIFLVLRGMYVC